MPLPDEIDSDKLSEVALAILSLTLHTDNGTSRAWKGMDWDLLNLLHEKGWIGDPVGKQKSVVFDEQAIALAEEYLEKYFSKS